MTKWKHFCNIKQHLSEDTSYSGITLAANSIAKELRLLPSSLFEDYNFSDDVMFLEGVDIADEEVYDCEQELLDEMNYCLNSIYDFADLNKIWLGN